MSKKANQLYTRAPIHRWNGINEVKYKVLFIAGRMSFVVEKIYHANLLKAIEINIYHTRYSYMDGLGHPFLLCFSSSIHSARAAPYAHIIFCPFSMWIVNLIQIKRFCFICSFHRCFFLFLFVGLKMVEKVMEFGIRINWTQNVLDDGHLADSFSLVYWGSQIINYQIQFT